MALRSSFARLLTVLCVFAVLGAQVFGLARAFVCDCGGDFVIVKSESCHGPHGPNCHVEESEPSQCPDHGHDGGDHKQHDVVKEDLKSTAVNEPLVLPAPVLLALLPELMCFTPETVVTLPEYPTDAYGGPPASAAIARTVVLLI